jgi:hypothetical protein
VSDVAKYLDSPSDRLVASIIVTVAMLLVATAVSFVAPLWVVLTVLFGPGILTFALGGTVVKKQWDYQLSTNQRLAIQRYRNADDETKKLFPKDWEKTVRNASENSGRLKDNDQYKLAAAAERIVSAAEARKKSLRIGDDKVIVALKMLEENSDMLEREVKENKEILS